MAPISFGGDDITEVTYDGDPISEITYNGDVVWTADGDSGGGGTEPSERMIEDAESYSSTEEFHNAWGVPEAYVDITTSNPLEQDQSINSGEAYADGTYLDSTTSDGYTYTALMVHGTTDDAPAFIVHQQSDRDVQDCIRCEIDARDDHVDLWVFDGGSILDEDRVEISVPTDYVYKYEMTVTSSSVDVTILQSDSNFSSSWSYATASFSEFTTISVPNNASYSGGMVGIYGGRGANTKWDRFTEVDDVTATSEDLDPVSFENVESIDTTEATFSGRLYELDGDESVDCWFRYTRSGEDQTHDTLRQTLTDTGLFSDTATGLDPGTTYDVYAMADTDGSLYASRIHTFTTQSG